MAATTWLHVQGMAVHRAGNLVFSERQSVSVWRIDSGGGLHRVAGTGASGTAGEGGPAASTQLEYPNDLAFDANGTLYISDQGRVLKIGADGNLVRLNSSAVPGHGGVLTADPAGRGFVTGSGGFGSFAWKGTAPSPASQEPAMTHLATAANPAAGDAKTAMFGPITGIAVDPRLIIRPATPPLDSRLPRGAQEESCPRVRQLPE